LTTFIDHRHGICDCRLPICDCESQADSRRSLIPPAGVPERVPAPFALRDFKSEISNPQGYRFGRSITDQYRQKRCSTMSARSRTPKQH